MDVEDQTPSILQEILSPLFDNENKKASKFLPILKKQPLCKDIQNFGPLYILLQILHEDPVMKVFLEYSLRKTRSFIHSSKYCTILLKLAAKGIQLDVHFFAIVWLVHFLFSRSYRGYRQVFTKIVCRQPKAKISGASYTLDSAGYMCFGESSTTPKPALMDYADWCKKNVRTHTASFVMLNPSYVLSDASDDTSDKNNNLGPYYTVVSLEPMLNGTVGRGGNHQPYAMLLLVIENCCKQAATYEGEMAVMGDTIMDILSSLCLSECVPTTNPKYNMRGSRLYFDMDLVRSPAWTVTDETNLKNSSIFTTNYNNTKPLEKELGALILSMLSPPLQRYRVEEIFSPLVPNHMVPNLRLVSPPTTIKCRVLKRSSSNGLHIIFPTIIGSGWGFPDMLRAERRQQHWYLRLGNAIANCVNKYLFGDINGLGPGTRRLLHYSVDRGCWLAQNLSMPLSLSPKSMAKIYATGPLHKILSAPPRDRATTFDMVYTRTQLLGLVSDKKWGIPRLIHCSIYAVFDRPENVIILERYFSTSELGDRQIVTPEELEARNQLEAQRERLEDIHEAITATPPATNIATTGATQDNLLQEPTIHINGEFLLKDPNVKPGITDVDIMRELYIAIQELNIIPSSKANIEEPVTKVFNKYFCYISAISSVIFRQLDEDEESYFVQIKSTNFKETFMPALIFRINIPLFKKNGEPSGRTKPVDVNLKSLWLQSIRRRTKNRIIFKPMWEQGTLDKPLRTEHDINTFYGWKWSDAELAAAYKKPGNKNKAAHIFAHIFYVLCDSDPDKFHWLVSLLSKKICQPSFRSPSSIIFFGPEGVGKSYLFERVLEPFVGTTMQVVHSIERAMGNFNDFLQESLFLYFDEAPHSRMKKHDSFIKNMITAKKMQFEAKYKDVVTSNVYSQTFFSTNDEITGYYGPNARRFLPYNVAYKHTKQNDPETYEIYWEKLNKCTNPDGIKAFFHVLKTLMRPGSNSELAKAANIEGMGIFSDVTFPKAVLAEIQMQKLYSLSSVTLFWISCLERGYVYPTWKDWAVNELLVHYGTKAGLDIVDVIDQQTDYCDDGPSGLICYKSKPANDNDYRATLRRSWLQNNIKLYNAGRSLQTLIPEDKRNTAENNWSYVVKKLTYERNPNFPTAWLECINMEQAYAEYKLFNQGNKYKRSGNVIERCGDNYKSFLLQTKKLFSQNFNSTSTFEALRPSLEARKAAHIRCKNNVHWEEWIDFVFSASGKPFKDKDKDQHLNDMTGDEMRYSDSPVICWLVTKQALQDELMRVTGWNQCDLYSFLNMGSSQYKYGEFLACLKTELDERRYANNDALEHDLYTFNTDHIRQERYIETR